jgi:hypothetical protein
LDLFRACFLACPTVITTAAAAFAKRIAEKLADRVAEMVSDQILRFAQWMLKTATQRISHIWRLFNRRRTKRQVNHDFLIDLETWQGRFGSPED